MFRTRVCRERRDKTKWRWFIWGVLEDSQGGYESEEEARQELAEELARLHQLALRLEDERVFRQQAFS